MRGFWFGLVCVRLDERGRGVRAHKVSRCVEDRSAVPFLDHPEGTEPQSKQMVAMHSIIWVGGWIGVLLNVGILEQ